MSAPHRIQLKRTKGWRLPANTVVVARPSRWGNPYSVKEHGQSRAVSMFRVLMTATIAACGKMQELEELRGKNLACWCPLDEPCHADILLELANK